MILLDTNVVSEPLRPRPDAVVTAWLDAQNLETLYLSALTVAELRYGIAVLPDGRRRDTLHAALETSLLPLFTGRILDFDLAATTQYAGLMAQARASGLSIGVADGMIAAIAMLHQMSVATRDAAPFMAAGVAVIDPWQK